MSKKCIYCKFGLDESSVLDVCRSCGLQVWGENMFNAIIKNMENAREVGDLYQGSVSSSIPPKELRSPLNSSLPEQNQTERKNQQNIHESTSDNMISLQQKIEAEKQPSPDILSEANEFQ